MFQLFETINRSGVQFCVWSKMYTENSVRNFTLNGEQTDQKHFILLTDNNTLYCFGIKRGVEKKSSKTKALFWSNWHIN